MNADVLAYRFIFYCVIEIIAIYTYYIPDRLTQLFPIFTLKWKMYNITIIFLYFYKLRFMTKFVAIF